MTGLTEGGPSLAQRLHDLLPHLGLDTEQLLVVGGELPAHVQEVHLRAWSYVPDFTPIVQHLLQLRRGGRCLSIAVCGPPEAGAARAFAAVQLAVGFTQHGLRAVVVDADVANPGLGGLVADPHQEGLVDMVRFGRSCRALLRTPVAGGPALLGIGSFPIDVPSPFENDAWLGIVHRVSVHAEVALFVAPLLVAGDLNPLTQATDQILYVPTAAATGAAEREVERLRRSPARIAAVVLCAPHADVGAPAVLAAETPPPERVVEPPEPFQHLEPQGALAPAADELGASEVVAGFEPSQAPPVEVGPALPEVPGESGQAAPEARRDFPLPPAWDEEAEEPAAVLGPSTAAPGGAPGEPELVGAAASAADGTPIRKAAARSIEEANELRRQLRLEDADFSYSEGGRQSRLPLFLFLVLVVTIGGFLGWALWSQRDINRRAQQILASANEPLGEEKPVVTPPSTATGGGPTATDAGTPPAAMPPDDAAAEAENAPPPAAVETATPPAAGAETQAPATPTPATQTTGRPTQTPSTQTSAPATQTPSTQTPAPAAGGDKGSAGAAEPAMVFAVHVASYRRLEQANQDIANLRKHGFDGRAVRTDLGSKGIWYRVYVGSYPTKAAASAARDTIVKLPGYDAFAQVRRIALP